MRGRVFQKEEIALPRSECRNELAKDLDPGGQDTGLAWNTADPGFHGPRYWDGKLSHLLVMIKPLSVILGDVEMPQGICKPFQNCCHICLQTT